MNTPIRIDRDKLFEEVWAEPMLKVSKRYVISDVGLAKACRRMHVPVPPRGYWARIAAGQKVAKPALPPKASGVPQTVELYPTGPTEASKIAAEAQKLAGDDRRGIEVEEGPSKPHPFILAAQKSLKGVHTDQYGRATTRNGEIDVRVSSGLIPRALPIMDALVKALDREGYKFKFEDQYGLGSFVLIEGQSVQFGLDEAMQRIEIVKPSDNQPWPSSSRRFEYRSTGKLRFRIGKDIISADQKGLPLERQLNPIFRALQQTGTKLRERQEEWERQRQISEQREAERQTAERQRQKLFEDVENWSRAVQLRRMIARTSELLKDQNADAGYAGLWLKWAEEHAAFLDPFSHGLEEFFKHYETDSWVISRRR